MTTHEMDSPPSMLPMFARAGAALIPGASRLPFVGGGGRDIPDLALVLTDVSVDRDRLAAYNRVCGFALTDSLPATFIHILAFPLHLRLMTDGSFPFPAIGLVHISNRIVQHRPVRSTERLTIHVSATKLEPHPRGRQFALRSEARVGDELVWEESATNLRRGGGSGERGASTEPEIPSTSELPATATWKIPGDQGRRYASVSGDLNPIHMHSLSARLFGFPSAIAHGMWTKARCLAALESRLPERFTVEAAFRKPILLPATVEFVEAGSAENGNGIRFGVRDAAKGTPHLDGRTAFG
jgi:MaoC dehydratase-like protein